MFQNITSGYTLEPVTHILCLRKKKTLTSSNSSAVHVKYVILLCTFFLFFLLKTKIVGTRKNRLNEHSQSIFFQNINR